MHKSIKGFTLVELLIVIVVIAILAAITVVAYNGVQTKARDSSRKSSITTIAKGLELYYIQNGAYPTSGCTSDCVINSSWSDTNDGSWKRLTDQLVPEYISSLPSDPAPDTGSSPTSKGVNGIAYFSNTDSRSRRGLSNYCGVSGGNQMYFLIYRLESGSQQDKLDGVCDTTKLGPYANSNYRVVHGGS